jgi:protein SCO1/2
MFLFLLAFPLFAGNNLVEKNTGEGSLLLPHELQNATLLDKAGVQVPLDIKLTDQDGRKLMLGDYFSPEDKRPKILTIGYYGCPMLCTLVLNALVEGLKGLSFKAGSDYQIISVSIDEREQPDLAKSKQNNYLQTLDLGENPQAWTFHVMSAGEAKRLAEAVGFNYYFDKKIDQFAHGAGFFVLSPTGILARTLFGISFTPGDIKLSLRDAADGKIGSFLEQILLSCFHYDPDSQRYGVYIMGVMRLGGIVTVLLLGGFLLMYFRQERKRSVV